MCDHLTLWLVPLDSSSQCFHSNFSLVSFSPCTHGGLWNLQDEVLTVIRRVDDNWAEGMLGDKIGIFPLLYVEVSLPTHL